MERLKDIRFRSFIVAGLFIAGGLLVQLTPAVSLASKTEKDMEQMAPDQVGEFRFEPSMDNPEQSYKVDERTYELLKPFGVVGRRYTNLREIYDVLLIAGNNKNSFHDNRVCFSGQGFNITKQENMPIETSRGTIPATFLTMKHMQQGEMYAVMFYKGPKGKFFPLPQNLTFAMLMEQLQWSTDLDSVFYRFIPMHQSPDKEELIKFVKDYMAAAEKSSKGFY